MKFQGLEWFTYKSLSAIVKYFCFPTSELRNNWHLKEYFQKPYFCKNYLHIK